MKYVVLILILSVMTEASAASAPAAGATPASATTLNQVWQFYPSLTTMFPLFVGGGFGAVYRNHYQVDFQYGFTPKPYYQVIGSVAAKLAGDSTYNDVVQAAFQNNSLIRLNFQYNVQTADHGLHMGLAASRITATGTASIQDVLYAATGQDYTNLVTLLQAAGKSSNVDMNTNLVVAEALIGYSWPLKNHFVVSASGGILAVMNASVKLKTVLPNFEASPAGSALISSSESDIESIIGEYGISPNFGASMMYLF